MTHLATRLAPPYWGPTFGGFGAAAIVTSSRDRNITDLVNASTTLIVISPSSVVFVAAASTFFVAATGTVGGVQGMPRV